MGERETTLNEDLDRSTSEIKESIEDTRERMDSTLEQLNQRIVPTALWEALVDWKKSRGGTSHVVRDVMCTLVKPIQKHPLPTLALGASAVWLAIEAMKGDDAKEELKDSEEGESLGYVPYVSSEGEYHVESGDSETSALDSLREKGSEIKQKASEFSETAKEKLKDVNETLHEKGKDLKHSLEKVGSTAKGHLRRLEEKGEGDVLSSMWDSISRGAHRCQKGLEENPIGMATGLLGVGVLLGSLFPGTRREDELMGDYSTSMKSEGRRVLDRGKQVAKTAAQPALHEVQDSLSDPSGVDGVVRKVEEAVGSVKRDMLRTAEEEHLIGSDVRRSL